VVLLLDSFWITSRRQNICPKHSRLTEHSTLQLETAVLKVLADKLSALDTADVAVLMLLDPLQPELNPLTPTVTIWIQL